ncbi:unnamed protein product [Closterium sp. NIES-53]
MVPVPLVCALSVGGSHRRYAGRQGSGGAGPCTYVLRTGDRTGEQSGVAIFDLNFDAILAAMYAVSISAEGDCYVCVPPDPGIEAAALGASESAAPGTGESALSGTASAQVFHTFTLDLGASRSFFRDRTTLTPLSRPIAVSLADPSGGPFLARYSTVLPCPAAPSGSLSGLYLPLFSTNLVAASSQVFAAASRSGPESGPCSCRLLSHQTLLWHHRLGHPSLPRLRGMASRVLGHERYFLLVIDDYSRYTTVFPLRSKGGEFSSDLLRAFCRAEGICQTFTLPASPQQNGIAERRIGMVMDVVRTSMIHAAAPHFLWLFAVQYAAHQINLQPRVSLPKTSPTLRWMGQVGDASAFRVWGSRAFVRDLSADKLSSRAVPCDITFDESAPYYRLFPYCTAPLPPPPLFFAPGPPPVDPLPHQGPAPSGVSQVDAVEPVEVAADSSASRGAEPGGAESGGAEPGGAESGGAEPGGAEPGGTGSGGAASERVEPGGAEPGAAGSGGELREWFALRWSRAAGAGGAAATGGSTAPGGTGAGGATGAGTGGSTFAGGTGAAGPAGAPGAGAGGAAGVGATGGPGAVATVSAGGPAGAGAAGGSGASGAAGVGAAAGGAGVVPAGSRGAARPRPYFVPLLEHVLGLPPFSGPAPSLECPPPVQSESQFQPASPLPAPSLYVGPTRGLAKRREPESRPALPVCAARTSRRVPRPRPPAVPGTHQMALRPSTAPQRVPLLSPPESSLPALADPASDSLRAASPTVTRLLATVVTYPSFASTAASALVTELVDFASLCRLDCATSLVADSASVCPPFVGGECALSTDVLIAAALPHLVFSTCLQGALRGSTL